MNFFAYPHVAGLVGHLEQSTFTVLVAWMLALVLRPNRPGVRFWIWFLASLKFLLPFSILVDAGEWLRRVLGASIREPAVADVIRRIPLPLSIATPPGSPGFSTNAHGFSSLFVMISLVWGCGSLILIVRWWRKWRRIRCLVRNAVPSGLVADVPILLTSAVPEPGVCGVIRPVLLLPLSLRDRLSHDQLRTIISHEMCHVRRRDNLLFAVHMAVETLFWFHPFVWWIGSNLLEERERACDEATILAGMSQLFMQRAFSMYASSARLRQAGSLESAEQISSSAFPVL